MDLKYLQVTKGYTLKYNLYREISFIILIKLFLNRFVLTNAIFIIFKPTLMLVRLSKLGKKKETLPIITVKVNTMYFFGQKQYRIKTIRTPEL